MRNVFAPVIGIVLAMSIGADARAGIVLNTTRVVYPAQDKEAVLSVLNNNSTSILLQSWLEAENEAGRELPFVVVPPLVQLPSGGRQTVRIIHSGAAMPADRESLFWLNVQEIPQASERENVLQIGIRQRIKLFYRPGRLDGDVEQAPGKLRWSLPRGGVLNVLNTGPYYVTLVDIQLQSGGHRLLARKNSMLAPGQSLDYDLHGHVQTQNTQLNFSVINDHGALVPYRLSAADWSKGQAQPLES
ncbi:molecular chaperone [Pseudomonas gingeri]|uniref:fimbrial biogenesis chaperone n=1 Tax=Pseudomonas gingeri TaxID=117681 RepID=UPI0015A40DC5|nr:molecular chaperone [Pseudomonas gingeri]NWA26874.1 molecular chaperone [Pseudomonas gingeri]